MNAKVACAQPRRSTRTSSDSAWPLRDAEGRTWAERKRLEQEAGL